MRTVSTLTCLALAALPLAACEEQRSETRAYEITSRADAIAVNSLGGRITVTAGVGDTVRVTETLRYTGAQPTPEHQLVGTDLSFTSGCQGHRGSCGVDYRIEAPATVAATLDSAGGVISVTGLSGRLSLTSGGGTVDASGISADAVTARTGGGAASLTFARPPRSVRVDSGGGDVTLRLPEDRYRVDARDGGGATTVEIPTDAAATRQVGIDSGGGAILVSGAR